MNSLLYFITAWTHYRFNLLPTWIHAVHTYCMYMYIYLHDVLYGLYLNYIDKYMFTLCLLLSYDSTRTCLLYITCISYTTSWFCIIFLVITFVCRAPYLEIPGLICEILYFQYVLYWCFDLIHVNFCKGRGQGGYRKGVEIAICMYWSAGLFSSEWLTQQV